jgi:hypothetical protein
MAKTKIKKALKKEKSYSKLILSLMLLFLLFFTCACLWITFKTGAEPSTLITCVFAFCGVEGGLTAWIKTVKVKNTKDDKKNNSID